MLTDTEVDAITIAQWGEKRGLLLAAHRAYARAIEAEVHRQDDALIQQMLEALSLPCDRWSSTQARIVTAATDAAHQRLGDKP